MPLLASLASERNLARAFWFGYLSGAIFLAGSCYWFVGVVERYGGLSPPLAVGVLALFLIVFSIFYGVFGLVVAWVARLSLPLALALSPFLWVSLELARTYYVGGGFPWNLLGYAVRPIGLRQLASFTAVYGLSFLGVSASALLGWVLLGFRRKWVWCALVAWLALLIIANWISTPSPTTPGGNEGYLVQPNVPLEESAAEHWAPWRDPAPLERLVAMTLASLDREGKSSPAPPLVVWSENPAPFYFSRDPVFRRAVENMARKSHAYVIVGTVAFLGNNDAQPQNSAVVLDPEGQMLMQYDKIHLVPFGEYVPSWAFPGKVGKITSGVGNYVPGSSYKVARISQGTIGICICYEAIFPQLVRRIVSEGAGVLVNISNDAWYGDSSAAFQHLEMASLRAIENHRFLLRVTNDGITAVIDPNGRVVAEFPRHKSGVLPARFAFVAGRTFYSAHGDLFAWFCVVVSVAVAGLRMVVARKQCPVRRSADL